MGQIESCCVERRPKNAKLYLSKNQQKQQAPKRSKPLLTPRKVKREDIIKPATPTCSSGGTKNKQPQLSVVAKSQYTPAGYINDDMVPHNPEDFQGMVRNDVPLKDTQPSTMRDTTVIDEVDSEYNEAESDCTWNQRESVPNKNLQDLKTSQFGINRLQSSHSVLPNERNEGPMDRFDDQSSTGTNLQIFRLNESNNDDARSDFTTTQVLAMGNSENASDDLDGQSMASVGSVISFQTSNFVMGKAHSNKKATSSANSFYSKSGKNSNKKYTVQNSMKSGHTQVQRMMTSSNGMAPSDSISQGHVINLESGSEADYPVNLSEFCSEEDFSQSADNNMTNLKQFNVLENDNQDEDDDDDVNFVVKETTDDKPSRRYSAYNQKANQIVSTGAFDVIHEEIDETHQNVLNRSSQHTDENYSQTAITERTDMMNLNNSAYKIRESPLTSKPIQEIDSEPDDDE